MKHADAQDAGNIPELRPWSAPRLATLDLGATRNGPAPNIEETALTDTSLAPS